MQYGARDTLCAGISALSASLSSLPMKNLPPSTRAMRTGQLAAGAADTLAAGATAEGATAEGATAEVAPLRSGPGDWPPPRPKAKNPAPATTTAAPSPSAITPAFERAAPPDWPLDVGPCGSGTEIVAAAAMSEEPPGALRGTD